jgi:hypothetical protein
MKPKQPNNSSFGEEDIIHRFLDSDSVKVKFAEQLALYVIENKLQIPEIIKNLIEKAVREVEK